MKATHRGHLGVLTLVSFLCMLMFARAGLGADWPLWRNQASNAGSSTETVVLPLTLRWHSAAPLVEENGAVVVNGIAYMSTTDGFVHAFVVATGFEVSGFPITTASSYGTPAVDAANNKIYVLTLDNFLHAYNLDGTLAWSVPAGTVGLNYNEGPIVDGGFIYFNANGVLSKYDSGGLSQWSVPTLATDTQPSIMGAYVYTNSDGGLIQKYDKLTGVEILGGGFPIVTAASQAALTTVDDKIFNKADVLYAYSALDGGLQWSQPDGGDGTYYGSVAVSAGAVYVYGFDGKMYAFDETLGTPLAGFPSVLLNSVGDRNWGSPSVAGDKVFIGAGQSQNLVVVGAAGTASAGLVLDDYATFSTDTQGFDLCSPIVSDGWVFAMLDGGGLYAFQGGVGPQTGVLKINGGASCTESQGVVLSLDNGGDASIVEMTISEDPFFTGAVWEPYMATKPWTLSAGFGSKTVYAKFRNAAHVESNVFSATIKYLAQCIQISLAPAAATNPVGTPHTVTATIQDSGGAPQPGVAVVFSVLLGPNTGASGTCSANLDCTTNANGEVSFTYTGSAGVGTDTIRACFTSATGGQTCSQTVTKDWVENGATPSPTPTETPAAATATATQTMTIPTLTQTPVAVETSTAAPTASPTPTVAALDHFQCYETHHAPSAVAGVTLTDEFGTSTVTLELPKRLCNPASKNGEDPAAPSHRDHLVGYRIRGASPLLAPASRQTVTNQFGTISVDLLRPNLLLVPSAKGKFAPPAPLDPIGVDHFQCYKVAHARFRASAISAITVQDQFGTLMLNIKRPTRLCVPVETNGEQILDATTDLLCYEIRQPTGSHFRAQVSSVFIDNELGPDRVGITRPTELCVPSERSISGVSPTPTKTATPTGTTVTPTPTGTTVCEGNALRMTVTTDAGSDLDIGWTGIAHNSTVTEDSSVTADLDCVGSDCIVNGTNLVNMPAGPPLPLSSGGVPVCVLNTFREAVTGTYNCETGCSESSVKILSKVFLVQDIAMPCPLCNGDPTPNDGQKGGTCVGGTASVGAACDVAGISAQFGATSNDCLPAGSSVGELAIDINPLSTGTVTQVGTTNCVATGVPDNCFCPNQNRGNACDSGVCPASNVCEDGPIDGLCSIQTFRPCQTDSDCEATFPGSGTCVEAPRPCFTDTITRHGTCGTQSGVLAGFFCIPPTRAPAINITAGLPGPGALLLPVHEVRVPRS